MGGLSLACRKTRGNYGILALIRFLPDFVLDNAPRDKVIWGWIRDEKATCGIRSLPYLFGMFGVRYSCSCIRRSDMKKYTLAFLVVMVLGTAAQADLTMTYDGPYLADSW